MNSSDTAAIELVCHPATICDHVRRVRANLVKVGASLHVGYCLEGALALLRIPKIHSSTRADNLWKHSCFELFIRNAGSPRYLEFNLSPSLQWSVYEFVSYRKAKPLEPCLIAPMVQVECSDKTLELKAIIELPRWLDEGNAIELGLSAVVEASDDSLSYWALRHPASRPDFHHPDAFAVVMH